MASNMTHPLDQLDEYLAAKLSPPRVAHIRRVAATARELATIHGLDPERAHLAAMLHDLARETSGAQLLAECQARHVELEPIDLANPMPRLHGRLAALWAEEKFAVHDPEVLAAIASHTLGRVGMSPLEMVVFLSDYCEPGRELHTGLGEVRTAARQELAVATRMAMDYTIHYLVTKRRALHPQMVEARNWILTRAQGVRPQEVTD